MRISVEKMEIQNQFAKRELAKKPKATNEQVANTVKKEFGYPISASRVGELRAALEDAQNNPTRRSGRRAVAEHRAMRRGKKPEETETETTVEETTASGTSLAVRPEPEELTEIDLPEDLRSLAVSFTDALREQQFTKVILSLGEDSTTVKYERVIRGMAKLD